MTISTTETALTITGQESPIASIEIDGALVDFTGYTGSLESVSQMPISVDGVDDINDVIKPAPAASIANLVKPIGKRNAYNGEIFSLDFGDFFTGTYTPLTYTLTGTLPDGLSFSGNTLSGTPTEIDSQNLTISVEDGNGNTASDTFTLNVIALVPTETSGHNGLFRSALRDTLRD